MTTDTERPEPLKHTFTITVDVDPRWVEYVTQRATIFSCLHYAGYWARGVDHDPVYGWLVAECDESERWPDKTESARVSALWRAGSDLPPRWYALDRGAALRMWEEGVKRFGVGWYDSREHDGAMEDVLLQLALLGEERYG
jgi:hypothetical protein